MTERLKLGDKVTSTFYEDGDPTPLGTIVGAAHIVDEATNELHFYYLVNLRPELRGFIENDRTSLKNFISTIICYPDSICLLEKTI